MTRRDLSLFLPALGLMTRALSDGQTNSSDQPITIHSRVFSFDELPVTKSPNGAATRPIMKGKLPTGEVIELHETTLMPGQMPHAAHKHVHTELMLIREGNVELVLDGSTQRVGAGGVVYAASQELHGLKNVGEIPAIYFVMSIGSEPHST